MYQFPAHAFILEPRKRIGKGLRIVEIWVLHNRWESEDRNWIQYRYALVEYAENGKSEYAIRCSVEGKHASEDVLCWLHPRLAENETDAYEVLYRLACRQISPVHLEDVLADLAG